MRSCVLLTVLAGLSQSVTAQTFEPMPIGVTPNGSASDVSKFLVTDRGQGLAGGGNNPRIWTRATPAVLTPIPALPVTHNSMELFAISHDGSVIAGRARNIAANNYHAVRLVLGGSWEDLGVAPGGVLSEALALDGDGSRVGGDTGTASDLNALLWTAGTGPTELTLPYTGNSAKIRAFSGDGSVMVGLASEQFSSALIAWYWTSAGGYVALPVTGAETLARPTLSRNGAWVACGTGLAPLTSGFIWSPSGGREDLPIPAGATGITPYGISDDGSVVAGTAYYGTAERPWVWRRGKGYLLLDDALVANLPPSTFSFWTTFGGLAGVSADGLTVYGIGQYKPSQDWPAKSRGWLSVLPAVCDADLGSVGGVHAADGVLDNNDFIVFIDYFFAQDPLADMGQTGGIAGGDGAWDNNDFVVFIDRFFAGC